MDHQYRCFKKLIHLVIQVKVAYAKGDMNAAADYYKEIYDEFDKCKEEFGEDNLSMWSAYHEAMSFISDDEVYDITDYIKETAGYYD